jgi:alanine racemase
VVRVIVQKDSIISNLKTIQKEVKVPIIAVLKGNGYGIGDTQFAKILLENGIKTLAVSRIEEAEVLVANFPRADILLMTPYSTENEVERIVDAGFIATVGSFESAVLLNGIAEARGVTVRVHIKIDTGMGRFGFLPEETNKVIEIKKFMTNLDIVGIFTHLSNCFDKGERSVREQYSRFTKFIEVLERAGVPHSIAHIANSSGALLYPWLRLDAVRIGSALLGRLSIRDKWGLKKVGKVECIVSDIRWLPKGHNIGYADTFKTKKATRIAVIPAGYSDGLFMQRVPDTFRLRDILRYSLQNAVRLFKDNKLYCHIDGKRARVLGRIGLASIVVDITDIDCVIGQSVFFDVNLLFVDSRIERAYV